MNQALESWILILLDHLRHPLLPNALAHSRADKFTPWPNGGHVNSMPHGRNLTWVSNVYESAPMPTSILRRVDVTTDNQAFSSNGCNIFPGLSYSKTNNTF